MSDQSDSPKRKLPNTYWLLLLSLLLLLSVIGVKYALPINREREAILEMKHSGAIVGTNVRYPEWFWGRLGDQWETAITIEHISQKISDADIAAYGNMPNLKLIYFSRKTQISDVGIEHFSQLTKLEHLLINSSHITDKSLIHLSNLPNLEALIFYNSEIGNDGLPHLKNLRNLEQLCLRDSQVDDAGLVHLSGLPQLYYLDLTGTKVSDEAVEKLQNSLPNCIIHH